MNTVFLADADPRTLNVLGVSLEQARYEVTTATDGLDALGKIEVASPDVLVTATRLQHLDGWELVAKVRERPGLEGLPVIFLATEDTPEDRRRSNELGVEEYVKKPVFVRELIARVELLLARRAQREFADAPRIGHARLEGTTRDIAVVDIVQDFEASHRSGAVHLRRGEEDAHLYFRDGRLIDAELSGQHGEEAVYRALGWLDARFEVELDAVTKKDAIGRSTQTLVRRGMLRLGQSLGAVSRVPSLALSPSPPAPVATISPPVAIPPSPPPPTVAAVPQAPAPPRAPAPSTTPPRVSSTPPRLSSAPVTKEIRPSPDDSILAEAVAAGIPSPARWAKRLVVVTVAAAAGLLFVAGARSLRPAPGPHPASASVEAAAVPAAQAGAKEPVLPTAVGPTAAVRTEGPSAGPSEVPAAAEQPELPAQSTGHASGNRPASASPLQAAAPVDNARPAVRETALDVSVSTTNQSPLVRDAERALLKGDTERALSVARQAVAENPADAEAWLTLAAAQKATGDLVGAGETYRGCVKSARTAGVSHCRVLAAKE
jgi:DNA-binding response OmpR family regulator